MSTTKNQGTAEKQQRVKKEMERINSLEGLVKFELPGDKVEGLLMKVEQITTKFGTSRKLELLDESVEPPEKRTVILKSALEYYDWDGSIGLIVEIIYTGDKVNPATGRRYKDFEVNVYE